jgi:hypothetical protein
MRFTAAPTFGWPVRQSAPDLDEHAIPGDDPDVEPVGAGAMGMMSIVFGAMAQASSGGRVTVPAGEQVGSIIAPWRRNSALEILVTGTSRARTWPLGSARATSGASSAAASPPG